MNHTDSLKYDAVIVGNHLTAICMARYLKLKMPQLTVAIASSSSKTSPVSGQSLSEIANLLIGKELGLYEYIIEHHSPKFGLNFHWPKENNLTETLKDYYHIWTNRQPHFAASHLHWKRFKTDLQVMNEEIGIHYHEGDFVSVSRGQEKSNHQVTLETAQQTIHLISPYLIETETENSLSKEVADVANNNMLAMSSVWVQVKNIDRTLFHDGYDPTGSSCSHYYATNYWLGTNHWVWMIPIDKSSQEVLIGINYHLNSFPSQSLDDYAAFSHFLEANHQVVANIIESGEVVAFSRSEHPSQPCSPIFSEDNYYCIPSPIPMDGTFYNLDTTIMAIAIESVANLIQGSEQGDNNLSEKREAYQQFNQALAEDLALFSQDRAIQSGHASLMSWRIYLECMGLYGVMIPLYVGKWHLNVNFIEEFLWHDRPTFRQLLGTTYQKFNRLRYKEANLGLMDCYRGDQLWGHYHTLKHFDTFWEDAKYEPSRCNVFTSLQQTTFYLILALTKLQWQSAGLVGLFSTDYLASLGQLWRLRRKRAASDRQYRRQWDHFPSNSEIAEMMETFKSYQCQPKLQNWPALSSSRT